MHPIVLTLAMGITATVCDIAKHPEQFNGRMVTVRSPVRIAFEDFELSAAKCEGAKIQGIWLQYGSGPKRQPTTWCCGDLTPRDPLAVTRNDDFNLFDRLLTAAGSKPNYSEPVTATITGRIDAAQGFGHFGLFGARLVIQRVSNVTAAARSSPPFPSK